MRSGKIVQQASRLLLVGVLALALSACGDESDETAPAVTLDKVNPTTLEREKILTGTMEPGATVEVAVSTGATVEEVVTEDGTWRSRIANLALGANTVTVTASDQRGNSDSLFFNLTYEILTLDRLTTPTPLNSQTVGGLLTPGATLNSATLDNVNGSGQDLFNSVTLDPAGENWTLPLNGLAEGGNTVTVQMKDRDGNLSTVTGVITVDSTTPAPEVAIDPPSPIFTTLPDLTVTGTKTSAATLSLAVSPAPGTVGAVVDNVSIWEVPLTGLADGKSQLTATATDGGTSAAAKAFVVLDRVAPAGLSVSPADGADGVDPNAVITATFSEGMDGATVNGTSFAVVDSVNTPVAGTVSYNSATRIATFAPSVALASGAFTATVGTVAADLAGNGLAADFTWSFTVQ